MSVDFGGWEALERPGPDVVVVDGVPLRAGSRVRLAPRGGGDVFDIALAGRTAVIHAIESDMEERLHLAVTVEDDPGRDLGEERQIGHRFFFSLDEVEPLDGGAVASAPAHPRLLVAGIGNVFLGDDGFGVAVADRLGRRATAPGVHVEDYGIRGMDLAYALAGYDAAIFVDAAPRGGVPGTLYVIEADLGDSGVVPEAHGMDPVKVLALARELGELPRRVLVVACEPRTAMTGEEEDVVVELSEPVRAAVDEAVRLVERLLGELAEDWRQERTAGP
jgi:hydrogenase maturation protease